MKRILMLLLFVLAANAAPVTAAEILMHKYSMIECKVNATMELLDDTAAYNTSVENEVQKAALANSLEELKSYAEAGNVSGFNTAAVKLRDNMRNAAATLRGIKQQMVRSNGGKGEGNGAGQARMLNMYADARVKEAQCLRTAAPALARAEVKEWKEWQEQKMKRIRALAKKNLAVGRLNEVLNAYNISINRYNDIINNSTVEGELRAIRTELVQEQLKLRARYEIEYMRVLLGAMNETAVEKGYVEDVEQISSLLEGATQKTAEYDPEEFKQAWDELKEAALLMKELFNKIKNG